MENPSKMDDLRVYRFQEITIYSCWVFVRIGNSIFFDPGTEITGQDRLNYEHVIFSWHESAHPQLRVGSELYRSRHADLAESCLCSVDPVMPN